MTKPIVSIVKCTELPGNATFMNGKFQRMQEDLEIIKKAVKDAVEMAVGSVDDIVKEGQTVLIKPNIAFLAPPESFAVVDPRMIEAVVWYFKTHSKAKEVWIGENPSLGMHVGRARPALETAGMTAAAIAGGADKIIYFDEEPLVDVEIPGATFFKHAEVFKPFLDADVVINLPKMKVHLAGTVTLGLKNWNGIVPNVHPSGQQQGVHRIDLGQKMADMYRIRKADLTIIDALIGMEGQGPHAGTPVEMNLVIAGTDTVAVDAVSASIMGFEPMEVPAIRCAGTDGLGEMDLNRIDIVGEPLNRVRRFFKRPNGDPVGMYKDFTVFAQQTCPGCFVNVRGALDSFVNSGVNLDEFIKENGPVLVIGGGAADFEPEMAVGKNLFITGDCWKYFPTREKVEEAAKLAKSVTYYPGCAPVYIFSQLNQDLQKLQKQHELVP